MDKEVNTFSRSIGKHFIATVKDNDKLKNQHVYSTMEYGIPCWPFSNTKMSVICIAYHGRRELPTHSAKCLLKFVLRRTMSTCFYRHAQQFPTNTPQMHTRHVNIVCLLSFLGELRLLLASNFTPDLALSNCGCLNTWTDCAHTSARVGVGLNTKHNCVEEAQPFKRFPREKHRRKCRCSKGRGRASTHAEVKIPAVIFVYENSPI